MRPPSALLAACLFACGPPRQQSAFFSFEGSLQGWTLQGLELASGGVDEAWSITTDPTTPFDGASSARFFLDNRNGTGKIWLERTFRLASSGHHLAHLDFAALGTRDAILADQLIVGVLRAPPRDADALQPALRPPGIAGSRWTSHAYDFELDGGAATVVIGISGATRGQIVYHLDALTVLFADAP
ncbi:MAG: hypothetical protein ACJ79H_04830 [Myxococcales bacterium]